MHISRYLLIILLIGALTSTAKAQDRRFGLGLIIGEPTGISLKYYHRQDRAIDGAIAWRLWNGRAFHLHADHLWHARNLITVSKGSLPVYYGIGLRLRSWSDGNYWHRGRYYYDGGSRVDLGVRFPVGLAYEFGGAPLDVFLELVPVLDLVPSTSVEFDGAIGLRYWF